MYYIIVLLLYCKYPALKYGTFHILVHDPPSMKTQNVIQTQQFVLHISHKPSICMLNSVFFGM